MSESIKNRIDFVYIFDVKDGNPNGDPDAGNLPRTDPETGMGLVTDVCLKRKIRNYVQLAKNLEDGYDIFVKEKAILNNEIEKAHEGIKLKDKEAEDAAQKVMCQRYYDVRTFGAVMTTGKKKAGQVKGPVQLTFARSVDPVITIEHTITRMAVTTEAEAKKQDGDNRTMGRKASVPYGLYVAYGFISPSFAEKSGFSDSDTELLFSALERMFEDDRSAARGLMSARKLIVFKHSSKLGDAPANKLFDSINVKKLSEGSARDFKDYEITIDRSNLPETIEIEDRI